MNLHFFFLIFFVDYRIIDGIKTVLFNRCVQKYKKKARKYHAQTFFFLKKVADVRKMYYLCSQRMFNA